MIKLICLLLLAGALAQVNLDYFDAASYEKHIKGKKTKLAKMKGKYEARVKVAQVKLTSYREMTEEALSMKEKKVEDLRYYRVAWFFWLIFFGLSSVILLSVTIAFCMSFCNPKDGFMKTSLSDRETTDNPNLRSIQLETSSIDRSHITEQDDLDEKTSKVNEKPD